MQKLQRKDIQRCIVGSKWQDFRISLKGLKTSTKIRKLKEWKKKNKNSKCSEIQVSNYINALKRAGNID